MQPPLSRILGVVAAICMACPALAQNPSAPQSTRSGDTRQRLDRPRADRLNGAAKASDLLGMTVKNYQDQKLGKVEELAIDVETGRLVQVIVSTGGFLGLGNTLTAVPPGALRHDVTHQVLHLDADMEKLKSAPKFEMARWTEGCEADRLAIVYRHYGEESAFAFTRSDSAAGSPEKRTPAEAELLILMSRLPLLQKASKVIGTPVRNYQDEKLGKVENILVDLASGRLVAVLVSSGGFLGLGDELSAVPPTALRFNYERDTLKLDVSKSMLIGAPHFKPTEWPDFNEPRYVLTIYEAYQLTPYFIRTGPIVVDNGVAVDNTAINVRDRGGLTLTALDQGNSKADIATASRIRKEVIAQPGLSVNARNVKIITKNGLVTLRGPVNTPEEKRLIGKIAERTVPPENVSNQLEVKSADSRE